MKNGVLKLREDLGWSQNQLADYLGLTRQAVSSWERGESNPSGTTLLALLKLAERRKIRFRFAD